MQKKNYVKKFEIFLLAFTLCDEGSFDLLKEKKENYFRETDRPFRITWKVATSACVFLLITSWPINYGVLCPLVALTVLLEHSPPQLLPLPLSVFFFFLTKQTWYPSRHSKFSPENGPRNPRFDKKKGQKLSNLHSISPSPD